MAKYKIKVIKHLLKNNTTAKSGEIVDGSQLINLQASLDGKFVELVEDEVREVEEVEEVTKKSLKKLTKEDLLLFAAAEEIEISEEMAKNKKDIIVDFILEALI